jgi:hypothetical protein
MATLLSPLKQLADEGVSLLFGKLKKILSGSFRELQVKPSEQESDGPAMRKVDIVKRGDEVVIDGKPFSANMLREVYFKRKTGNRFNMIADVFNAEDSVFTASRGSSTTVVSEVGEDQVPVLMGTLKGMKIRTLCVSPLASQKP